MTRYNTNSLYQNEHFENIQIINVTIFSTEEIQYINKKKIHLVPSLLIEKKY